MCLFALEHSRPKTVARTPRIPFDMTSLLKSDSIPFYPSLSAAPGGVSQEQHVIRWVYGGAFLCFLHNLGLWFDTGGRR